MDRVDKNLKHDKEIYKKDGCEGQTLCERVYMAFKEFCKVHIAGHSDSNCIFASICATALQLEIVYSRNDVYGAI